MKKEWTYKKLGEVAEIVGGSTPKTDIEEYWGGNHYWVTPAELDGSKYIESTQRTITDKAIEKTNLSLLPSGTVLLSSRAPIGKVCITKSPMYCNQGFKNIVCGDSLYNEFVYYTLCNSVDYLQSLGTGATFKEISKKVVEKVEIPVPSIEEQHQIVAELDLLSGMIEKQKAQIEELNKLAQSIFYDMFGDPVTNEKGWEVKKLKEICSKITDGTHNSPTNDAYGAYMYITAKNIKESGLSLDNITYVSEEVHKSIYERCNPVYGDVLYIKDGATTGIAVVNNLKEEFSLLSSVALLKPGPQLVNQYLKAVLNNPSEYKCIRSNMGGAAITRLTIKKIEGIEIPLPPLSLQQEFAAKIEAIEAMKAKVRQSLKESETLFNSRMDYYFN